ncbi:MAG: ROK family protein [Blautia massiliensis (ex Durand et al. 2017)]|uniref:ROK family transcriptional regulator n=1 Tax=uncultured Subdoligranulum sp. TaxID=512298 RepID=UPI00260BC6CD|nr:ROK family protein [uncultured Subdoligranulum sp.]
MTSYVPEYLKAKNRKTVFDLFLRDPELSRAEIVQRTRMSFPTASKAVDFLISRGIVTEIGSEEPVGRPGRRRRSLRFNPSAYAALALNFEGRVLEVGLVDLAGQLLQYEQHAFDCFHQTENYAQLAPMLQAVVEKSPCHVLGVGIGMPADIDNNAETVALYYDRQEVVVPLKDLFGDLLQALQLQAFYGNDVNLACLGEASLRGGAGEKMNLCYLTLGTGFGAGIMNNGAIWLGGHGRAGEIGNTHLGAFDLKGPLQTQIEPLETRINLQALEKAFGINLLDDTVLPQDTQDQMVEFLLPALVTAVYNFSFLFDMDQFVMSGAIPNRLPGLAACTEREVNRLLAYRKRSVTISRPVSAHCTLIGAANAVFEGTILSELQG